MQKYIQLFVIGLLLTCTAFLFTGCTVTEYGVPYNYGSTMEAHSAAGRWGEYNHYRAFGPGFGNNSMDPHLR